MALRRVTIEVLVFAEITAKELEAALRVGAGESCDDMMVIHNVRIIADEMETHYP